MCNKHHDSHIDVSVDITVITSRYDWSVDRQRVDTTTAIEILESCELELCKDETVLWIGISTARRSFATMYSIMNLLHTPITRLLSPLRVNLFLTSTRMDRTSNFAPSGNICNVFTQMPAVECQVVMIQQTGEFIK